MRGDGRRRGLHKHPGSEALHVAIDDHSRLAFTQLLPDQKTETTVGFLNDALDFFERHGIRVRALLTDNGSSYRSHMFRQACCQLGHQTPPNPPLHAANQRQGRTLYPDRSARVGLCQALE